MMNIFAVKDCYGCGVCSTACSKHIIEIGLNEHGFYEPHITDTSRCTDCGLCTEVCSYMHDDLSLKNACIQSYAAWSNDKLVRRKCSSGGVGFEVGRTLIENGYKVCGVRYDAEKNRAEHYVATTVEELIPSIGSKYIQSYTIDGFRAIDRKQKYLVTGTPCQIDSFRRYIRKFRCEDNFVLMDFFCHGVPSFWVWKKYVEMVEKTTGKITYASWRNKFTGWHDSWAISIDGEENGEKVDWHDSYNVLIREKKGFFNSRLSQGDAFYKLFLSDACLGKACYEKCKFKYDRSSADIRIGDLWGKTYESDEDGVSAAIAFTEKGDEVLKSCNCTFIEHPFEVVAEGQMKKSPAKKIMHTGLVEIMCNQNKSIPDIINILEKHLKRIRTVERLGHPVRTLRNIVKRIFLR